MGNFKHQSQGPFHPIITRNPAFFLRNDGIFLGAPFLAYFFFSGPLFRCLFLFSYLHLLFLLFYFLFNIFGVNTSFKDIFVLCFSFLFTLLYLISWSYEILLRKISWIKRKKVVGLKSSSFFLVIENFASQNSQYGVLFSLIMWNLRSKFHIIIVSIRFCLRQNLIRET